MLGGQLGRPQRRRRISAAAHPDGVSPSSAAAALRPTLSRADSRTVKRTGRGSPSPPAGAASPTADWSRDLNAAERTAARLRPKIKPVGQARV